MVNLHDRTKYIIHIRNLKEALNHGLVLKRVHKVIKFNQNAWLKPYVDMNADLKSKSKNNFEKIFFNWWIMQFLGKKKKTMENVGKHSDIKLVTTERRRNYLVSQRNYHNLKFLYRTFINNRNKYRKTYE